MAATDPATLEPHPFDDARIVWHLETRTANENYPLALKVNGNVQVGQQLDPGECAQSLRRGGDGFAAIFEGGWLSLDVNRAKTVRPEGNAVSLYVRAWVGPEKSGTLVFSDFLALAVHGKGFAICFLGVKTPHGKVFRELPLGPVDRGCWLDLVVRVGDGKLDLFSNGLLVSSVPIEQSLCSPFDEMLQIGAFMWGGPDLYEYGVPGLHDGKIDTVALWGHALEDGQIALLSGVERLGSKDVASVIDRAVRDYNTFFDASVDEDIDTCNRLWMSLREIASEDPCRPTYHLTQPFGSIYDPAGAYYYGGRYHIFSYHNILYLLRYCSLDHYVSDDLVHWQQWPIGPWADCDLDVNGIWLMNHFIDDDGIPSVIYTGLGTARKYGVLARSHDDLLTYGEKRAVLTRYHHDGHVWKEDDTWYTITSRMYKGTRSENRGDGVMLWSSPDLEDWRELGEIFTHPRDEGAAHGGDRTGFMEFPYLLPFGDKHVLMLGAHPVRYWVGHFDLAQVRFIPETPHGLLLDYTNPFHCFNPLCVDDKGPGGTPRRIVMALEARLNDGGFDGLPWNGVHVIPRSLQLEVDHLRQDPLPEMQSLRGAHHAQRDITVEPGTTGYLDRRGDTLEVIAEFEPGQADCFGLKLRLSDDGASFVRVWYDTATDEYGLDGSVPNLPTPSGSTPGMGRGPSYLTEGQPIRMHVFLDKLLVEVFINGQTCTSVAQDRDPRCVGLDLFSEGAAVLCTQLDVWDMNRA
jgi:beta-fructofuranosidase